jgi:hypothetical protein
MEGFPENASLGSHADRFFQEAWAFSCQKKCPRLAATGVANTLAVATSAIFIRDGAPNWRPKNSLKHEGNCK